MSPLQIPNPLPLEVNAAIAVAGGEVWHRWCDEKVGSDWSGGYKASYEQNTMGKQEGG